MCAPCKLQWQRNIQELNEAGQSSTEMLQFKAQNYFSIHADKIVVGGFGDYF